MPFWLDILIYILTGTGGVAGAVLLFRRARRAFKARAFGRGFKDIHETYGLLLAIMNELGCHRVMMLKAENSGGIPRPGHPLTSSVVYEVFRNPLDTIRDKWQQQECDQQYVGLLATVHAEGSKTVKTRKLQRDCYLRDLYEAQNVGRSEIFSIGIQDDSAFMYLSCVYINDNGHENGELDAADKTMLRAAVNRLKILFETIGGI